MAWDEKLFSWLYDDLLLRKNKKKDKDSCLHLQELQKRLQILCSAVAEKNVEIRPTHSWGGLQGQILFLPEKIDFSENKEIHIDYYLWRALSSALALQKVIQHYDSWSTEVHATYPALRALFDKISLFFPENQEAIWGHLPVYGKSEGAKDSSDPSATQEKNSSTETSELKVRTVEKATLHKVTEENESPLTHVFEKVHTAEDYQGGDRKMDGRDEIQDHADALNEVTLSHVIRTNQTSESLIKSNAIIEVADAEHEQPLAAFEKVFQYPEWFASEKQYRKNWCTLFESKIAGPSVQPEYSQRNAHELRMKIQNLLNESHWLPRQADGSEIDLAAVIDRRVQLHTDGSPTERIYQQQRRKSRNLSTLILIDSSLSTDCWIHGEQILTLMKKSLLIIQDAFQETSDSIAIAGFHSNTRHQCQFQKIKDFKEGWENTKNRIGQLQSTGYTRIGPALRHAQFLLNETHAKNKLLLLLSDAKPTDYDQYEGRHGVHDIQKAVIENQAAGQKTKVLGFIEKGYSHHESCFGAGNFYYLKNENQMSEQLFQIWSQALKK